MKTNLLQTCLLAAALLVLPAVSQAQLTYITNNGAIVITGYIGSGGGVSIPATINGLPVTSIGVQAFSYSGLMSVTIPNSVTTIGEGAFWRCSSLTNALIGNGVTTIGDTVFAECNSLISVTIPNSVTSIGIYSFQSCSSLPTVTIPNSVTNIVDGAFSYCYSLTNVTIGNNVTTIGGFAFYDCESLTSVTIPNSVTSLGYYVFADCYSLTSVTIPDSVTSIGDNEFSDCESLTAINVDPANLSYSSLNGVLFDKSQTTLVEYPPGLTGSYTIPDSVANIESYAFQYCYNLTRVMIPNSVTNIDIFAFNYCTNLTSVTIGNGITMLGNGIFADCILLTNVTIPNSVIIIWTLSLEGQRGSFEDCISLTSITIPDSVTNIGSRAFAGCESLTNVYFKGDAPSVGYYSFDSDYYAIAYYLPGTTGWDDFSANTGLPTVLWLPQVQTGDASFGVRTNQFGFNINWASGQTVVVEACFNLANPVWQPVQTNTLASDSVYFSDPRWTNYPARFYRLRSP